MYRISESPLFTIAAVAVLAVAAVKFYDVVIAPRFTNKNG